ncbi:putative reverse transcriptase domain-containing protein [Tanacetum coccineum]
MLRGYRHSSWANVGNITFIHVELQFHELRKTSIRHEVPRYIEGHSLESHNALGYSIFRYYPDLGVLQIGIRVKLHFLLHHLRLPTLPSTLYSEPGKGIFGADGTYTHCLFAFSIYAYMTYTVLALVQSCLHKIPQSRTRPFHLRMYHSGVSAYLAWSNQIHQTPPVPQDEDEREPMFLQPHDPDYVPEPMYLEYIQLEDEHVFPAKEQPLPPVVSPTTESPGYVAESDPEEDPEEYEDDESDPEDGLVDYPMDWGDDDDGDSSGDEAEDEDEDEDEEDEEEEHLALADSAIVVPTVELVSSPEGTEPVTPPPSPDITTTRARITVRLQASISLPPEAEVERLLTMPTPPPSPPSVGERLARIASTLALIDAVTAALPSPLLPPLPPSLYIPPPVDHRDDIPESELPPRKRSCLSTLGSREVGYGIRDTWVDPKEAVPEIAPMTLGDVNTRVTELAELHEHDTQDLYALLEDAQDSRTRISQRVTMNSQRVNLLIEDKIAHQETVLIVEEEAYASREAWAHSVGLSQAVHYELQTYHGSHSSDGDNRRNVQTARPCFYADFMKCQPLNFKGTEGVVGLTRWIEKMESVFNISGCAIENQVKFATCTLLGAALTWWNGQIRTLGPDAYAMTWEVLKKKMTDKYCPQGEIKKLEIELWNLKVKGNDVPTYTERFQELTLICTKFVANETEKVDKYISGLPDNIYGNVKSARPKTLDETIELANDLMD